MENKKGQGIFLGVVGVATLVVAIIGATFAYFSASTTAGEGTIQGQTLGGSGGVLGLTVEKVTWTGTKATTATSNDLVPTDINASNMLTAINASCEQSADGSTGAKYTGCHLYKISTSSSSQVASATLKLNSLTATSPTALAKWKYALFKATDSATTAAGEHTFSALTAVTDKATPAVLTDGIGTFNVGTGNTVTEVKILENEPLAAGYSDTYYLLVYIENIEESQNSGGNNDVVGSYTGEFEFASGAGEHIKATFTA